MKTAPNDEPTHGKACPSGIDRWQQRRDAARLATKELGVDSLGNAKEFTKACASTPREASIHVLAADQEEREKLRREVRLETWYGPLWLSPRRRVHGAMSG